MRVGVIGLGEKGSAFRRALQNQNDVEWAAVADWEDAVLDGVQGVPVFSDWRTMLEKVPLDVVAIATPRAFRGEMIQRSLRCGIPVWVEGLPCQSSRGARHLAELARTQGLQIWCYDTHSWRPAMAYLEKLVSSHALGTPLYLRGQRCGLERRAGDVLWQWGAEDLGALVPLIPGSVKQSRGMAAGEGGKDLIHATFGLAEWLVSFEWNRVSPELRHRWWMVGTKRAALVDFQDEEVPLRIVEWEKAFASPPLEPVELVEGNRSGVPLWVPECPAQDPRLRSWEEFCRVLRRKEGGLTSRAGIRWMEAVEAIDSGVRGGKPVELLELL